MYISSDESEADSGNDALLDENGLEVIHNNLGDDDDIDLDLADQYNGTKKQDKALNVNMYGPPQLRSYSNYTSLTHIDWDSLRFENIPHRTITKIIDVSFAENGLEININWEQRLDKIKELK
ncbi:hypothetical protein GPJ56_001742 [Histomonas meleagridis]|uniref:uncharacterized protein n=1 Tax=Histomonas meleagridis TaxID=135588 RepID=UPI00355ABCF7|nr:hypothetical protein GPJ56_001742 [Histomonas meleagridis]KAH0796173.1 hypothetical protein GO595_010066 [Histomonas meleagridis]